MVASEILLHTKTDTKEEELDILNGFLERLQYNQVTKTPRESPDFELIIGNTPIGVEIKKYYSDYSHKGSKSQQKLSEWVRFSKELKSNLQRNNQDFNSIYGAIHFKKSDISTYSQLSNTECFSELVQCIRSANLKPQEASSIEIKQGAFSQKRAKNGQNQLEFKKLRL